MGIRLLALSGQQEHVPNKAENTAIRRPASFLGLHGRPLNIAAVLFIDVPDPVIVERLVKRAVIEGRSDDTPETVAARLRTYREKTEPLAELFRDQGLFHRIDGDRPVESVAADVLAAVNRAAGRVLG